MRLRKLATDRFVIFLVLGASFFLVNKLATPEASVIAIGPSDIAMLKGRWQAQSGEEPNATELASLVDYHIREEILVREAHRLGLDRDDVILRRRLAQKMELLIRDRVQEPVLTPAEIAAYFQDHQQSYVEPKRVGFRHVFLGSSDEAPPETIERVRSELALSTDPEGWRALGRPFMLARQYGPRSQVQLAELFGTDFANRLIDGQAPGNWWGPVRSSYGLHLVQTVVVLPERAPTLAEVREKVIADLREARLKDSEARAWEDIRARYSVSMDLPPA